jgi:hypothetical protein
MDINGRAWLKIDGEMVMGKWAKKKGDRAANLQRG